MFTKHKLFIDQEFSHILSNIILPVELVELVLLAGTSLLAGAEMASSIEVKAIRVDSDSKLQMLKTLDKIQTPFFCCCCCCFCFVFTKVC